MGYRDAPENDKANPIYKGAIKTVHRLDRQTSGIVFFAKSDESSNKFRELMEANEISKVYYARVKGNFSECPGLKDNKVEISNFTYCVNHIDAIWECAVERDVPFEYKFKAKESITVFKFKHYDSKSNHSIIKCYPKTGRTHQIRVHLQHLGYPIAND